MMTTLLQSRATTRPSRPMTLAWVLCLALCFMGSTRRVAAQETPRFPAALFGKANLTLPQHLAGPLENLLDPRHDNFERIGALREDNRYRRLSNAVGRLDLLLADQSGKPQYTSICTASLIAEDLLLTSYHCIPGVEPGRTVAQAQLRMGYLSAEIEGTPYAVTLPPVESHRALDYAIVRVQGTPGRTYGTMRLELRDAKAAELLVVIHHPQGYPKRLTRRDCFAAPSRPVVETDLAHHCDTLPGSSGAPVFSDDDFALVGLHYAGYGGVPSSDTYNYAKRVVSIQQVSAQLQRLTTPPPPPKVVQPPEPRPTPPAATSVIAPSPSTVTLPPSASPPTAVTPPPPQVVQPPEPRSTPPAATSVVAPSPSAVTLPPSASPPAAVTPPPPPQPSTVARLEPEPKRHVRDAVPVPAATIRQVLAENPWTNQVQTFRMDLSPVSNREFLAFVQAHPQWKKSQMASDKHDGDYLKHWQGDDRIPAGELDEPVRYVSYCAAAAYCKEQGAYLPSLNQYRVASSERVAFRQIDYETSYSAPAFHFMQTEWTNTWWPSSGPRDPGKRVPYMHGSCHGYQRGDRCYTPEQENRYTGRSLGFRCARQ